MNYNTNKKTINTKSIKNSKLDKLDINNMSNKLDKKKDKKKKNDIIIDDKKCFTIDINEDFELSNYISNIESSNNNHYIKNRLPWIEKYRPSNNEDLILCPIMKNKIDNIIKSKTLPNIILTGSPGTGKTSTVLYLAKKIIGSKYKDNILELNASDNRGLDYINSSVLYFCKKKISQDNLSNEHKFIIFDEADNITKKAQNALANLMEQYSNNTRFAFTCNDSSKIIEGIQSRCIILQYLPLEKDKISERIINICNKENIKFNIDGIDRIITISSGDIRQAINNLEATFYGYNEITVDNVNRLCYQPHPTIIFNIIKLCVSKKLYDSIDEINKLKLDGYCASDILLSMINILKDIQIDEDIKINFIKIISDTYIIVSDGIDSNIQLYSCLGKMINYIKNS